MADKFILVVSDPENSKQNEVTVLDSADDAKRTLESLLEAGYEQDGLRVFAGSQIDVVATYRPVVALVSDSAALEAGDMTEVTGGRVEEPEAAVVEPRRESVLVGVGQHSGSVDELDNTAPAPEEPTRQFASLFRRQYEAAFENPKPRASKVLISAAEEAA